MLSVNEIRNNAFMIINNIAFMICKSESGRFLRTVDLNNLKYVADFRYDKGIKHFSPIRSTFANGKRKYEMLYSVERNTEEIVEVLRNA